MQIHLLASGSDGNATLVISGKTAILIDAGIGPIQLKRRLALLDLDVSDLQALFITHEHYDHISGLAKKSFPKIPIFANRSTSSNAQFVLPKDIPHEWHEQQVGEMITIGDLTLTSFATSHDSALSVGFQVTDKREKLLFATDLGVTDTIIETEMRTADYIVLEANHDLTMLREGPYPLYLKRRVASQQGHLSNEQAADILATNINEHTRWIGLAHLSRTNNFPSLALRALERALNRVQDSLHPSLAIDVGVPLASGLPPVSSK